jgi:hypothetical protein
MFGSPLDPATWHDLEAEARTPDLSLLPIAEAAVALGDKRAPEVLATVRPLLDAHATAEESLSRHVEEARGILDRLAAAHADHERKAAAAIRSNGKAPAPADVTAYSAALRDIMAEARAALIDVGEAAATVERALSEAVSPLMRQRVAVTIVGDAVAEAGPLLDRLQVLLDSEAYGRRLLQSSLSDAGVGSLQRGLRQETMDEVRSGARRDPAVLSAPVVLRNAFTHPDTLDVLRRAVIMPSLLPDEPVEADAAFTPYRPADEVAADAEAVAS